MTDATPDTPTPRNRPGGFGGVAKLPSGKWRARYVDKAGNRHSKTFPTKTDARVFLASKQTDIERGDRTDPRKGKRTFEYYAERWLDVRGNRAPKTLEGDEAILRLHVLPAFGKVPIANIEHDDVQRFVSRQTRAGEAPGTVRKRYRVIFATPHSAITVSTPTARVPRREKRS